MGANWGRDALEDKDDGCGNGVDSLWNEAWEDSLAELTLWQCRSFSFLEPEHASSGTKLGPEHTPQLLAQGGALKQGSELGTIGLAWQNQAVSVSLGLLFVLTSRRLPFFEAWHRSWQP